ncbi:unnamed protein product [Acanthosepion pharaonis]|uniref:Uncharacterized protein n=1 Tax=Acanthosepion pharaonis TaxID=158019 RepID=A0A812DJP3_ACAPH|nr:unnamed protein product [Sepia pharaonis]
MKKKNKTLLFFLLSFSVLLFFHSCFFIIFSLLSFCYLSFLFLFPLNSSSFLVSFSLLFFSSIIIYCSLFYFLHSSTFILFTSYYILFLLQGNSVEMFFIKPGISSAPFKLGDFLKASTILASNNLLSNVQTQIPQLQIKTLQPATDYRISMEDSLWVQPYFPYIIASCAATTIIILVAIMVSKILFSF